MCHFKGHICVTANTWDYYLLRFPVSEIPLFLSPLSRSRAAPLAMCVCVCRLASILAKNTIVTIFFCRNCFCPRKECCCLVFVTWWPCSTFQLQPLNSALDKHSVSVSQASQSQTELAGFEAYWLGHWLNLGYGVPPGRLHLLTFWCRFSFTQQEIQAAPVRSWANGLG